MKMTIYKKSRITVSALVYILCVCIHLGDGDLLEADCNATEPANTRSTSPVTVIPTFSFRSDRLTRDECRKYAYLIPCSPVSAQRSCNHLRYDDDRQYEPRSKTYLEISCDERDRVEMGELIRNVSGESPTRAITLELQERNGTDDPIHTDVFQPIRSQIIVFKATCATKIITSKIYDAGVIPNLFRLSLEACRSLTIKKRDFSRMPSILMISFRRSTIEDMERYTFTDLPTLQSLQLEVGMGLDLQEIEEPTVLSVRAKINIWDVEKVRRLHCDCSFAWFRNFLKDKQYLSDEKRKGSVFVVGNYLSPYVRGTQSMFWYEDAVSADCSQSLTVKSARTGIDFSYNTSCYKC